MWVRTAVAGLVLGVLWGVAARVWMRMITTSLPEFSWSGTLLIVSTPAVAGLAMGLVRAARLSGRTRWWRLLAILAFPVAIAPQGILVFLPAYLVGGLALSGRLPPWARVVLGGITVGMPFLFAFVLMPPGDRIGLSLPIFILGLWVLQIGLASGGAELFRKWPRRRQAS